MIFDDLKNITFTKEFIPIQTRLSTISTSIVKIHLKLGKYEIDGDKVFLVVQENVLNQAEMINLSIIKTMQICICWQKDIEYSSYGSRIKDEAVAFDEASDIGFVHCHEKYPLLLGYHNFAIFFPGRTAPAKWLRRVWKKRFANISLKF